MWRSQPDESAEEFDVQVEGAQRYRLCFETSEDENKKEDDESNGENTLRLGFNVRVKSAVERALPDTELGPETIRALELLEAATATEQKWQNLQDHFDFARSREAFHTKLTSQIHNRVMGWTIIEAVLVVTMAVGQVCYWKSFFEQRRYL